MGTEGEEEIQQGLERDIVGLCVDREEEEEGGFKKNTKDFPVE